ncbi:hypothetical protein KPL42_03030 [Clostridium gasigenes]|uniref:hypothetical protein n=1 Tax=Clostridium gasigenes TaxID=94869 RepID=UPI001C0E31AD|nr:hypothetical protein [Clostridium gasigenes]MBU3087460.1 hypothetical protein [Clostridium gasigenes]
MRYKGVKIKIMEIGYNFEYRIFTYGRNLIIYINDDMSQKHKSKILHRAIREYFKNRN